MKQTIAEAFWRASREAASRLAIEPRELVSELGLSGVLSNHVNELRARADEHGVRLERLRHRLMLERARDVSRALDAAGIPHLFMRGIALVGSFYDLGERELEDVDLLIGECDATRVLALLEERGFSPYPEPEQSGPVSLRATTTLFQRSVESEIEELELDVHWGIESVERALPHRNPAPAVIWEQRQVVNDLPVPSTVHHLAITLHHLVHHDLLHVRGLFDAFLLLSVAGDGIDDAFFRFAGDLGIGRFARRFLAFARRRCEVPLSACGVRKAIDRPIVPGIRDLGDWLCAAGGASDREYEEITVTRLRRRLFLVDGTGVWLKLLRDVIFPPAEFLRWRWGDAGRWRAQRRHLLKLFAKLK